MAIYSKIFETMSDHSAKHLGSGGLEVLATPSLVCFLENTCYQFTEELIADDRFSTVGSEISIQHVKASKIGDPVTVHVTTLEEEGRRYNFQLEAYVKDLLVARACHTRVRIDIDHFLSKL